MNVFRFLSRQIHNTYFRLTGNGVQLQGKGIVVRNQCTNREKCNVMIVDAGASFRNCSIYFKGNNNTLHICCGTHLHNASFCFEDDSNIIDIGEGVTSEGGLLLAACESCKIIIGDDCMFSNNIQVRTSDSHSILNREGIRINKASDLTLRKHVWVGFESLILKGSTIPNGCIIGARSIVTSAATVKENSIVAAGPVKTIKRNVSWDRNMF